MTLRGGEGDRAVVLLHGLGANAEVWRPLTAVIEAEGGWRWTAPDLPGHGRAARLDAYSPGAMADALLPDLRAELPGALVLGHSLGGVVGLALAAKAPVGGVVGLGIKVAWTEEEVRGLAMLAAKPGKLFDDRAAAVERALKVAGLWGLVPADGPAAEAGIVAVDGGWTLAMDPAANGVGAPDMSRLIAEAACPVRLLRGERDPMQTLDQLRALDPEAADLPGLGHSAMVEDTEAVWRAALS
jgi:pimeloyl-ACP methyl ester carboxylesterase